MKLFACLNSASYRPKRVLCVSKLSSLEFFKFQHRSLNEEQILTKMKEQGKDPHEILTEHRLQIACEENLSAVLKKLGITFRITKSIAEASKCVDWADLVIPIGGDGTFLLASKLISDNTKPVFGINPNVSSESNVFTLPSAYTADIGSIFEKLHSGDYTLLMRSRIRTQAVPPIIQLCNLENDQIQAPARCPYSRTVFMGEFLAARPITLVIQVAGETHKVRSSGICVCTGSGSRSWYKSMNFRPADTVHNIIEIATGKKLKPDETNDLLYKYHRALMYPPDDKQMTYMIREMVRTMRCKMGNCCSEREKCYKLTVKSAGFDAGLVIDGSISLPFNDGTTASFEIKPENSLRQILVT